MGVLVFLTGGLLPASFQQVIIMIVLGFVIYLFTIFALEPNLKTLIINQMKKRQ